MRTVIDAPDGQPPNTTYRRGTHQTKPDQLVVISKPRQAFGADFDADFIDVAQGQTIRVKQQLKIKQPKGLWAVAANKIGGWGLSWRRQGRGYGCKKSQRGGSLRFILRRKKGLPTLTSYLYHAGSWRKRCGDTRPHPTHEIQFDEWIDIKYELVWNTRADYDGSLTVWINGTQTEHHEGIRFWVHADPYETVTLRLWFNSWRRWWVWWQRQVVRCRRLFVEVS